MKFETCNRRQTIKICIYLIPFDSIPWYLLLLYVVRRYRNWKVTLRPYTPGASQGSNVGQVSIFSVTSQVWYQINQKIELNRIE